MGLIDDPAGISQLVQLFGRPDGYWNDVMGCLRKCSGRTIPNRQVRANEPPLRTGCPW